MTEKKITDEQLKQEIRKGKTEKEIAHDNGYGYPSGRLNQRIRELGYEKNQKLTLQSNGGATFYLSDDTMKKLAEDKDIDLQDTDKVFFEKTFKDNGVMELEITKDSFKQVE